jgi:sugar phosphate isomerase/epimerase
MSNLQIPRRDFLKNSLFAGTSLFVAPSILRDFYKKGSLINGVQIGVITYSYRDKKDQSLEATLQYVIDSGISAVELMGDPVEIFAGKPKNPVDFRTVFPLRRKKNEKKELTPEEEKTLADAEVKLKEYSAEVAKWREKVSMSKFEEVGKMFKKAGVKIYGFKPNAFEKTSTDIEIDYGLRAAKAVGANQVTLEHPSNDAHTLKLGTAAAKYGIKVGYHGHEQQTPTFWDTALAQSPANALNLDLGHFVAAGNTNILDFVKSKHQHIVSMHMKDRTTPEHGKGNLPWGNGDTPLKEVLNLMKMGKYNFPGTIELEYKIPEGSDAVAEVRKCLEFCKSVIA